MKIFLALVVTWLCANIADAGECESGWTTFKDEVCIKAFPTFLPYHEARMFCTTQGNSVSTAALVMIKDAEMQEFVAEFTKNNFDSFWIGGKYDAESAQFLWEDGQPLRFTNWATGYPRNTTESNVCIQLHPVNSRTARSLGGKWEDTACQRRNMALCQRTSIWTLEDATREIVDIRKKLEATMEALETTMDILQTTTANLQTVSAQVVPVGSIYIEYFSQPSPEELWPTLNWQDITNTYAGLFFRASGGNSEDWGYIQGECAPRISEIRYDAGKESSNPLLLPTSGWSGYGDVGRVPSTTGSSENIQFYVQDCEVHPTNQAVKIWKRLG